MRATAGAGRLMDRMYVSRAGTARHSLVLSGRARTAGRPAAPANLLHRNPGGRIPRRHGAGRRHGALGC